MLEIADRFWAYAVGNENGALGAEFIGNTGNSEPRISSRCCDDMEAISVVFSTLLDETRYPPIFERLRRLEVLEQGLRVSARVSFDLWDVPRVSDMHRYTAVGERCAMNTKVAFTEVYWWRPLPLRRSTSPE